MNTERRRLKPSPLPLEIWQTVGKLLNPDDYAAVSLAGLPGSERLDLKLTDMSLETLFRNNFQIDSLKVYQRRLLVRPVFNAIDKAYELQRITELVLWHLNWRLSDFKSILQHLPDLTLLEIDIIAVTSDFFDFIKSQQIPVLRIQEIRYKDKEDVIFSSKTIKSLKIGFYSAESINFCFSDMELLQDLTFSSPFIKNLTFERLPVIRNLEIEKVPSKAVSPMQIMKLTTLRKLSINLDQCHPMNLSHLTDLRFISFKGSRITLPKKLKRAKVSWTGCSEDLIYLLNNQDNLQILDITYHNDNLFRLLPESRSLKALKINNFFNSEEIKKDDIFNKFPNLEAISFWSIKRTIWFEDFESWCK